MGLKNRMVESGLDLSTSGCIHMASRCEHGNENMNCQHSGSRECGDFFLIAMEVLASEQTLCSITHLSYFVILYCS
jgi:hypothetical protein